MRTERDREKWSKNLDIFIKTRLFTGIKPCWHRDFSEEKL